MTAATAVARTSMLANGRAGGAGNKNRPGPRAGARAAAAKMLYIWRGPQQAQLSKYKDAYPNQQSANFVVPIVVILFLGVVYVMTQRAGGGFVSFVLMGGAAATMVYWTVFLLRMLREQKPRYARREQESKNWVYDLIRDGESFVFVAEVPGPDDKIAVRLVDGVLYVRGSGGFGKEIPIEGSESMQVVDFKYRNGVLTLRIKDA